MGIVQDYARATHSSSLQDDELHHDTEKLAAVALSSKLGSLLFRIKYAGDEMSLIPLMEIWRKMVSEKAKRHKWAEVAEEVADISLWHWIEDVCRECNGLGHPKMPKAPTLEAMTCQTCGGSGKKTLKCDTEIRDYVLDCVADLNDLSGRAARESQYKLGT